jgi:hypothetical protein
MIHQYYVPVPTGGGGGSSSRSSIVLLPFVLAAKETNI